MNDLLQSLKTEFQDEDYRYAYAQSFLNTKLASQIKTLREQRGMTQARAAAKMNIKQPGYRRFEDVNHEVWRTDSLWSIARAYGVRLDISFKTFGTLPEDKHRLKREYLQLPEFDDDPAFNPVEHKIESVASAGLVSVQQMLTSPFSYPLINQYMPVYGAGLLGASAALHAFDFVGFTPAVPPESIMAPPDEQVPKVPIASSQDLSAARGPKVVPIDIKRKRAA